MDIVTYVLAKKYADSVGTASHEFQAVKSLAEQCHKAKGYVDYSTLITELNAANNEVYCVGQSFLIQTLEVPDVWVYSVEDTNMPYTYTNDAAIKTALETTGFIQCGYYKLSILETLKLDLTNYISTDKVVSLTQEAYEALPIKDDDTYYCLID